MNDELDYLITSFVFLYITFLVTYPMQGWIEEEQIIELPYFYPIY
jgi:hypothetical protein